MEKLGVEPSTSRMTCDAKRALYPGEEVSGIVEQIIASRGYEQMSYIPGGLSWKIGSMLRIFNVYLT